MKLDEVGYVDPKVEMKEYKQRVVAIASYKGGTGKSTTSVNFAYELSQLGKMVLIVDTDPSGNTTSMLKKKGRGGDICNVFSNKLAYKRTIHKTQYENLDIIPGSNQLEEIECDQAGILKWVCDALKEAGTYDFIIIDCHPNMQFPTINALVAANDLIIPFKPDRFNLDGLDLMEDYVSQVKEYNPDINCTTLITMFKKKAAGRWKIIEELLEKTTIPVFDCAITDCEAVNNAQCLRKPISRHRRKCPAAIDYMELVKEYLERVEE